MIGLLLCAAAFAGPPGGELVLGWAGNARQGYGFATFLPALTRSDDASLTLSLTASDLYYRYADGGDVAVRSPGAALGAGFVFAPGAVSFGLTVSLEGRRTTRAAVGAAPVTDLELGAVLATNVYAALGRRGALYAIGSASTANEYLWLRVGGVRQLVPRLERGTAASLWLGLDGTGSGNQDVRAVEGAGVAELRIRDWRTSFDLRAGAAVQDSGSGAAVQGTVGASAYWWY